MSRSRERLERRVLLGPDLLCRAAASRSSDPEERWMLTQGRKVRTSYVAAVLDKAGDPELLRQIWMMRQPAPVRESFIREVLEPLA
ncbi:MAG: hypothetical protein ACR2HC_07785 [Thermoleophilaceae bacterium]